MQRPTRQLPLCTTQRPASLRPAKSPVWGDELATGGHLTGRRRVQHEDRPCLTFVPMPPHAPHTPLDPTHPPYTPTFLARVMPAPARPPALGYDDFSALVSSLLDPVSAPGVPAFSIPPLPAPAPKSPKSLRSAAGRYYRPRPSLPPAFRRAKSYEEPEQQHQQSVRRVPRPASERGSPAFGAVDDLFSPSVTAEDGVSPRMRLRSTPSPSQYHDRRTASSTNTASPSQYNDIPHGSPSRHNRRPRSASGVPSPNYRRASSTSLQPPERRSKLETVPESPVSPVRDRRHSSFQPLQGERRAVVASSASTAGAGPPVHLSPHPSAPTTHRKQLSSSSENSVRSTHSLSFVYRLTLSVSD
jgi:hypothetical protein